jgi:hypothetical protein
MKDKTGLYYYPFPENKQVRMYVRQAQDSVQFRMWQADDPTLWQQHGWVDYDAIIKAASMFSKNSFDPKSAYDIRIAKALIREDSETTP